VPSSALDLIGPLFFTGSLELANDLRLQNSKHSGDAMRGPARLRLGIWGKCARREYRNKKEVKRKRRFHQNPKVVHLKALSLIAVGENPKCVQAPQEVLSRAWTAED